MNFNKFLYIFFLILFSINIESESQEKYQDRTEVLQFVEMMGDKHQFDKEDLIKLLSGAIFQEKVIRAMNNQPEGTMTWSSYKKIMVSPERINSGKHFIETYRQDLTRAEEVYGVPAEIIASIIGIETRYGSIKGNIRVLDSLMTLSFDYPRRSKFFKKQLEEFLLLTKEEGLDISRVRGSIAGAMGYSQFMPDSYRDYAVDFDFDGKRDILDNPVDAIGSVANFLRKKGKWEANTEIAIKAELLGERPSLKSAFKPYVLVSELKRFRIKPVHNLQSRMKVVPIELELTEGFEYWLGLKNFYALSRYNKSKLYIMAVFEFSKSLSDFF